MSQPEVALMLAEHVSTELKTYEPAHQVQTMLRDKSHKWRAMSAMQKAIRRNNPLLAYKSARAMLYGGLASDMWRRLAVIATEDIALGDPYQAAYASMFAGDSKLRAKLGSEEMLMYWLIDKQCAAAKSRDLCDVVIYAQIDPTQQSFAASMQAAAEGAVRYTASASDSTPMERYHGFRQMWNRWEGKRWPPLPETARHEFMAEIKLPPVLQFIAMENVRATNETLALAIPSVWQLMCASTWAKVGTDPFDDGKDEVIGAVLSCTYDQHTKEGARAIGRLTNYNPAIQAELEKRPGVNAKGAMNRAVFYTDGAVLRPRLEFEGSKQLFDEILDAKLLSNGFASPEDGRKFYDVVASQKPQLDAIRRHVLTLG